MKIFWTSLFVCLLLGSGVSRAEIPGANEASAAAETEESATAIAVRFLPRQKLGTTSAEKLFYEEQIACLLWEMVGMKAELMAKNAENAELKKYIQQLLQDANNRKCFHCSFKCMVTGLNRPATFAEFNRMKWFQKFFEMSWSELRQRAEDKYYDVFDGEEKSLISAIVDKCMQIVGRAKQYVKNTVKRAFGRGDKGEDADSKDAKNDSQRTKGEQKSKNEKPKSKFGRWLKKGYDFFGDVFIENYTHPQ